MIEGHGYFPARTWLRVGVQVTFVQSFFWFEYETIVASFHHPLKSQTHCRQIKNLCVWIATLKYNTTVALFGDSAILTTNLYFRLSLLRSQGSLCGGLCKKKFSEIYYGSSCNSMFSWDGRRKRALNTLEVSTVYVYHSYFTKDITDR